jgi:hypothetical protein
MTNLAYMMEETVELCVDKNRVGMDSSPCCQSVASGPLHASQVGMLPGPVSERFREQWYNPLQLDFRTSRPFMYI